MSVKTLRQFKVTIKSEFYTYSHNVYGISKESVRKGWEQYGLNDIGEIIDIVEL